MRTLRQVTVEIIELTALNQALTLFQLANLIGIFTLHFVIEVEYNFSRHRGHHTLKQEIGFALNLTYLFNKIYFSALRHI